MQQVQGGKFARALQGLFGTQGKLGLSLDSVVIPTVLLGDLSDEAEGNPAIGTIFCPAGGAGNRGHVQIALPDAIAQFGHQIYIQRILVTTGAVSNVFIGQSPGLTAPTGTGTRKNWRDSNLQGFPAAVMQFQNTTAVIPAAPNPLEYNIDAAGVTREIFLDWNLRDGDSRGLIVFPDTDNMDFRVTFFWLEVPPA